MKYLVGAIMMIAVFAITTITPASAEAARYLPAAKAKKEMRISAREIARDMDGYFSGLSDCFRISKSKYECTYSIDFDDGMWCDSQIRARRYSDGYIGIFFPEDPICY